jgi:uncharacterized protein (TIGR03083 family)
MDSAAHVEALRRAATGIAEVARGADLGAVVPDCPEWDLGELVWHLTAAYDFWAQMVASGASDRTGVAEATRVAGDELLATFAGAADRLCHRLAATPADTPVWTWSSPEGDVAWVCRRLAVETALHHRDAVRAAGGSIGLDPALASDGIDEFLFVVLPLLQPRGGGLGGSVHLHCGDVAGEWTLRPLPEGGTEVTRAHAKGDCALRGSAEDLLLALWGRRDLDDLDVVGDRDVAAQFLALVRPR